jgi:hypothetical protein
MILSRSETSVQLTYTLEEYKEFNHAIVSFRSEITETLRNQIFDLQGGLSMLVEWIPHREPHRRSSAAVTPAS